MWGSQRMMSTGIVLHELHQVPTWHDMTWHEMSQPYPPNSFDCVYTHCIHSTQPSRTNLRRIRIDDKARPRSFDLKLSAIVPSDVISCHLIQVYLVIYSSIVYSIYSRCFDSRRHNSRCGPNISSYQYINYPHASILRAPSQCRLSAGPDSRVN